MDIRHHQVGPGENEGAWKISDPSKRLQARAIRLTWATQGLCMSVNHLNYQISHNANCDFVIYCLKLAVQKLGALMINDCLAVPNSRMGLFDFV